MRLSWDDGLRYPLGKMNKEEAKFIYDIGFRVAGIGGPLDATDDDIKYARDVVAEAEFLDTGTKVEIIEIHGNRVVVKKQNTEDG